MHVGRMATVAHKLQQRLFTKVRLLKVEKVRITPPLFDGTREIERNSGITFMKLRNSILPVMYRLLSPMERYEFASRTGV